MFEIPQHFPRVRAGAGANFKILRGRGRARGPIRKFCAGRAGAGADSKILRGCGRAQAGAPQVFAPAGARGAEGARTPHARKPRGAQGARLIRKFY